MRKINTSLAFNLPGDMFVMIIWVKMPNIYEHDKFCARLG